MWLLLLWLLNGCCRQPFPTPRTREQPVQVPSRSVPEGPVPAPGSAWMRIGELSRRVGLSQDRLRAWERRYGLLMPRRTGGGTRLYSSADEVRVRLMQRHISEGLSPAQAAELVAAARLGIGPGDRRAIPAEEAATAQAEMTAALDRFDETSAQR